VRKSDSPLRLGILGGTFNPPHAGHLALARDALSELGLDVVLLMPAHTPPHKPAAADAATPQQRLAMCELAADGVQGVRACALEVDREGPSYTVDTLQEIHDAHPKARLTLIVGADMALTLASWRQPKRLLELADLAIAERSGAGREQVLDALEPLHVESGRVRFLTMQPIDVSSSAVRERIAEGRPAQGLLPGEVGSYVESHHLYEAAAV
jgi:nicotinate-nucleotide adenylyltransferase